MVVAPGSHTLGLFVDIYNQVSEVNEANNIYSRTFFVTEAFTISGNISGAPGVAVSLAGTSAGSTTTDGFGDYSFSGLANGNYTITPSHPSYSFAPTHRSPTIASADIEDQDFTASFPLDCGGATTLTSGVSFMGDTTGRNSDVAGYSCIFWNEDGPEQVHVINTLGGGDIVATLSDHSVDLDVFILSECEVLACRAHGDNTTSITNAGTGTYYVVVDGYNGAAGTYTLDVTFTVDPSHLFGNGFESGDVSSWNSPNGVN